MRARLLFVAAVAAVAAVMTLAGVSVADDGKLSKAKVHYQQGEAYFKTASFDLAAAEYQAAYRLSGRAGLLFNIALARENHGESAAAIRFYRKYLAATPDGGRAIEAKARLAALERRRSSPTTVPLGGALTLRFTADSGEHDVVLEAQGGAKLVCDAGSFATPCQWANVPRGPAVLTVSPNAKAATSIGLMLTTGEVRQEIAVQVRENWFWKHRWTFAVTGGAGAAATVAGLQIGGGGGIALATTGLTAAIVGGTMGIAGFAAEPTAVAVVPTAEP